MTTTVLDPQKHGRLLADMQHIRETANIPEQYIRRSMKEFCEKSEVEWVTNFHTHRHSGAAGMVLVGAKNAETRMMGMCGALLRNFIDGRMVPMNALLAWQKLDAPPAPTVLFIPNLFVSSYGKALTAWQVQTVYDLLLSRFTAGKLTVCYVESMDGLRDSYGGVFADHLEQHYKQVTE